MKLEKYIKENEIVVFVMSSKKYTENINDVTLAVTRISKSVVYVSLNKPYTLLADTLKKKGVDTKKIIFIDTVTGGVQKPKGYKVSFVSSPKAFTELSIVISETMKPGVDAMILDSLSTLLIYEDPSTVVKFIHSVISKVRTTGKKCIIASLSEDVDKNVLKDVGMFVDKVIELK